MNRSIFVDKDGTLVVDAPKKHPLEFSFMPGAIEAMQRFSEKQFKLVVVTNQGAVAHGRISETTLMALRQRLADVFLSHGVTLDGFYYCPHDPNGSVSAYAITCDCRKPRAGLFFRAAHDLDIDLSRSWFIGDILNDVEAGRSAGCRTVFLNTGNETEWISSPLRVPTCEVSSWPQAADAILGCERG